jgi:hypothetical protein
VIDEEIQRFTTSSLIKAHPNPNPNLSFGLSNEENPFGQSKYLPFTRCSTPLMSKYPSSNPSKLPRT